VQAEWIGTAHADAWAGLQSSGHAASYCEGCHTVGALGNAVTNPNVGWAVTNDPRFHDVQCESCHGPGISHVSAPAAERPLASFEAGTNVQNGCGECHNGTHHPFVEQWAQSAHGAGPNTAYAGSRGSCARCHEGQAALEQTFGVDAEYLEKGDGEIRTITCVVCHDPHGSPFDGQLRASINVPDRTNLCMTCHTRRGEPWSSHGPHAAQGLLVLSEDVGYIPEGFDRAIADIPNPHGPRNNNQLCARCHVASLTITDASGDFLLESVGHTFEAVSCLDADGLPVFEGSCDVEDRTFATCTGSGCHGSETFARNAYVRNRNRINTLLDELWEDSNRNHVMEATDGGLLPQVIAQGRGGDLDPGNSTMTPAKGALWNGMLAWTGDRTHWSDGEVGGVHFSSHPNSGNGVHNPHLLKALLLASIGEVRSAYGLQ
ncbi:MAG: cytochrome c3 family protein, partial [Gemmatimonadetes bacterium]|nr:cytochrome c3 family protein [Gemmatimonadota bacterium]